MGALTGRVAIVTGASSGIGRAAAVLFAAEGAAVVVSARRRAELEALVAEICASGGQAAAVVGDVGKEGVASRMVEVAVERFGGLDVAFNNAGTLGALGPSAGISVDAWEATLRTNLTGGFLGAQAQIPAMQARGGGSIVFTSTFVGYTVGFPQMAAYAASKAGLIGLTQTLAAEYAGDGIRVNALLPGGTNTPMAPSAPEEIAFVEGLHALKRLAVPEEIARSALYLVSEASSFTTGTAMLVDGGVSICRS